MALERAWLTVTPIPLVADGTAQGLVTVADTAGFKVKGSAYLANTNGLQMIVQINQVISPTQMVVGKQGSSPSSTGGAASGAVVDISAFTVITGSTIGFPQQPKNKIKTDDIDEAIYEADPTVAIRSVLVDQYGNFYDIDNPIPIIFDGTISIGEVEVIGKNGNTIEPNTDGSINVNVVTTPVVGNVVINQYNGINSVASGATSTVVQYTLPIDQTSGVLQRISVSGDNIAKWTVFINADQIDTRRTYYGSSLSEYFEFITGTADGVPLVPGDIVTVKVLHNRPYVGDFEGRIQVLQIA